MEPWNRFATDAQEEPADFYRLVLTKVLDDLMKQAGGISQIEKVKTALRKISQMYKGGLSIASSQCRSDWSDPANHWAYVFLYLMQHCHLVYFSLEQCTSRILNSWRNKRNLKVCSIGGGPGSDLVGLTTFLRTHGIFPPFLECRVLDLYPNWKDTWDTIHQCIPQYFRVAYERCDVVRDMGLTVTTHRFIRQADMLTLVKLFSAVSAFFRADPGRGDLLRSILREIKPGCFVLYIDNQHDIDTQFEKEFASQVGLVKVFEFWGKPALPFGQYSSTVRRYHDELQCWPLSSCNVLIQLYEKLAVQPGNQLASRPGTIFQIHQTPIPPQHFSSSVIDRIQLGLHRRENIDDRSSNSSQPRYSSFPARRIFSAPSPSPFLYANQSRVPTSPVIHGTFPQSGTVSHRAVPQHSDSSYKFPSHYTPRFGNSLSSSTTMTHRQFHPSGNPSFPTGASYQAQYVVPCFPKATAHPNSHFNQAPTSAFYPQRNPKETSHKNQGPHQFHPSGNTLPTGASYQAQSAVPCFPKATAHSTSPFNQVPKATAHPNSPFTKVPLPTQTHPSLEFQPQLSTHEIPGNQHLVHKVELSQTSIPKQRSFPSSVKPFESDNLRGTNLLGLSETALNQFVQQIPSKEAWS